MENLTKFYQVLIVLVTTALSVALLGKGEAILCPSIPHANAAIPEILSAEIADSDDLEAA